MISVIGLGYIGLPTALCLRQAKMKLSELTRARLFLISSSAITTIFFKRVICFYEIQQVIILSIRRYYMELFSKIKNDNSKRIPEGMQALMKEKEIYILGTDHALSAIKKLKEFNIDVNGVIATPVDCKSVDISNIIPHEELGNYINYGIIVGFSWRKNVKYLAELCDNPQIKKLYLLEGASYYYAMLVEPQTGYFKHEKLSFVDSYYNKINERGLTYDYFTSHYNEFEKLYNMLEDDLSKESMVAYLDGHINLTTFPMSSVKDINPQYFPNDIIKLSDNEVYVDCGGWDGDTVNEFIRQVNGKYNKIYVFEPDKKMIPKLKQNIDSSYEYILFNKGTFNQNCRIGFDNAGCGKIDEYIDSNYIETVRLDDVIKDKISYIKMDVEGSELQALEGGKRIITESIPKMAICVYHKKEDLITIPQFIKSISHKYKLYLRGYYDYVSELVLYAIPE